MKPSKIHLRSLVKDIIDGLQHIMGKKKLPAEIIRTQIVISVKKKKKKKKIEIKTSNHSKPRRYRTQKKDTPHIFTLNKAISQIQTFVAF